MALGGRKIDLFFSDFWSIFRGFWVQKCSKKNVFMDKNDEKASQASRKIWYFGQNPDFRFWISSVAKIPPPPPLLITDLKQGGIFARNRIDLKTLLSPLQRSVPFSRRLAAPLQPFSRLPPPQPCGVVEKTKISGKSQHKTHSVGGMVWIWRFPERTERSEPREWIWPPTNV